MTKEEQILELKTLSQPCDTIGLQKETISIYHNFDDDEIEYGCANNYMLDLEQYEVYIFTSDKNIVANNLLPFITKDKKEANKKYNEYKEIIKRKDLKYIKSLIK